MNAQTVIAEWTRDYVAGATQLTVYAADDVDVVGLVHRAIAAENNNWREDGKGFRKGRWTMSDADDGIYVLHHDDFIVPPSVGISVYWTRAMGGLDDQRIAQVVQPVVDSFFTWHAENYPPQPAEPTGLGAVVRVVHSFTRSLDNPVHPWIDYSTGVSLSWQTICELGPITVLSEGVTS